MLDSAWGPRFLSPIKGKTNALHISFAPHLLTGGQWGWEPSYCFLNPVWNRILKVTKEWLMHLMVQAELYTLIHFWLESSNQGQERFGNRTNQYIQQFVYLQKYATHISCFLKVHFISFFHCFHVLIFFSQSCFQLPNLLGYL